MSYYCDDCWREVTEPHTETECLRSRLAAAHACIEALAALERQHPDDLRAAEDVARRLALEAASLREDKRMLDWLEAHGDVLGHDFAPGCVRGPQWYVKTKRPHYRSQRYDTVRAAIRAAMEER